ncbi:TIGR03016 family PEP-CTERM system-associated outer membrane protein [Methylomonas sp. MgM2]
MDTHNHGCFVSRIIIASFVCFVLCGLVLAKRVAAFEWRAHPSLSMSEVFSDNLALSSTERKSGFVSEVAPGFSLYGQSPWSNFNLNYRLQGLYNAGGSESIELHNQLQMNSLYQAVRNTLFLRTSSSISQQNINNSYIATDNITGNRDRTTVTNFDISPYWTPHFGQYASGLVRGGYRQTGFNNGGFDDNSPSENQISDSTSYSADARLLSGSKFHKIRWNLNYSLQHQNRDSGEDVQFERYHGDLRYFINRKFNVYANFGYENNDYQTLNRSINNGFFYTIGGRWSPSRWYSLEAGYGNNYNVTARFNPSNHLTGFVTYRYKNVGLNTGSSWDADINYRAQQGFARFRYAQETTTVQQILTQQYDINVFDPSGNVLIDPETGLPFIITIDFPLLVDDVIISKQGTLTFGYRSGKSFYDISLYNTRRTYELNPQQDNVFGASASWRWQIESRLNLYLRPTWQSTDISNSETGSSNTRYDVALGLSRAIPINLGWRPSVMQARLEFRHISQMSDLSSSDYTENRATAGFAVRF